MKSLRAFQMFPLSLVSSFFPFRMYSRINVLAIWFCRSTMEQIEPIIISLRNHQNQAYTGLLGVGPHLFRVSFHTGMKGIWIPGRISRVPNQVHAYDGGVSPTYNEAPGNIYIYIFLEVMSMSFYVQ